LTHKVTGEVLLHLSFEPFLHLVCQPEVLKIVHTQSYPHRSLAVRWEGAPPKAKVTRARLEAELSE